MLKISSRVVSSDETNLEVNYEVTPKSLWGHFEVKNAIWKSDYDWIWVFYSKIFKTGFVYTDLWSTSNSLLIISRSFLLFSSSTLKWPQVTSGKSSLLKWYRCDKESFVQFKQSVLESSLKCKNQKLFRICDAWFISTLSLTDLKMLKD